MPPIQYPFINGHRHDWSSARIDLAGRPFGGIKSLTYKHKLDPGMVRGNSSQPMGRTRGEYSAEGNIEMYLAEYYELISGLSLLGGYLEVSFDIVSQYSSVGLAVVTDTLRGVRLTEPEHNGQEGNEGLTVRCGLSIMYLLENGLSPLGGLIR